jgi:hypothetical protein
MLSKCANPSCSATFRYLSEGKLFHLAPGSATSEQGETHERFWLCGPCSGKMNVVSGPAGVLVVPLQQLSEPQKSGIAARPWES